MAMTKEELVKALQTIQNDEDGNEERNHIDADNLLLKFIGDKEVTAAFKTIYRYYI